MPYFSPLLRSYSLLFFSQHRGFGAVLLVVSFGHPWAGAAGLLGAALAVGGAQWGGFHREWADTGSYSFNALLVGLALGTFFEPGWALLGLVVVGAALALGLSVALGGWLGGRGLPFLSLPAVAVVWLLLLAGAHQPGAALSERGIYWLNEVYALGGPRLVAVAQWVGDWPWPPLLATYLRALSAVLFQDSAVGGLLVAAGLLWHSRIAFSLAGLTFLAAYGFGWLTGTGAGGVDAYNLGANYVMAGIAVGGVFVIPSAASYLWALASVPITAVLLGGLGAALGQVGLPALALPFCGTSLLFLYVLLLRERVGGGLVLTPVQRYSPEANLYAYTTSRARLVQPQWLALALPFLGEWRCTQGYLDGGPTHQGPWGQALDFAIADADGQTYQGLGFALTDFYAYNKPVLAPADGVVEEVVQHIADNPIGQVNTQQNWGNTVVLRHAPGLYTQLSHLRPHASPVKPGDQVRRGDIVGYCGNSGRSPEPHLHFQVQATPYVGSRTLAYPLAYFLAAKAEYPEPASAHLGRAETAFDHAATPCHESATSCRDAATPCHESATSCRDAATPCHEPATPCRDATTPCRDATTPCRDATTPCRDATTPCRDATTPCRDATTPRHGVATPCHELATPCYGVTTSCRDAATPRRDAATPFDDGPTASQGPQLRHFAVPVAGETISPPTLHRMLGQALRFPPGYALDVRTAEAPDAAPQRWEVFTDAYNDTYFRCQHTGAVAYFARTEAEFYFTAFYGAETSGLYTFYQAAYRVPLAYLPQQTTHDVFPLSIVPHPALAWVQDVVAPFFRFLKPTFSLRWQPAAGGASSRTVQLCSRASISYFGRQHLVQETEIGVADGALTTLRGHRHGRPFAFHLSAARI